MGLFLVVMCIPYKAFMLKSIFRYSNSKQHIIVALYVVGKPLLFLALATVSRWI